MEMNPQDDNKPATKADLRESVRALEEKMDKYALTKEMRHAILATHEIIKSMAIGITQFDGKVERLIGNLRDEIRAGFREQKAQIDARLPSAEQP